MRTIDDYIDAARARAGIRSDRQLAIQLGLVQSSISQMRTKRIWPSDETMIRLAIMAGIDPAEALLELSAWRTEGTAQTLWRELARKLGTAATVAIMVTGALTAGLVLLPSPAAAAQGSALFSHLSGIDVGVVCILRKITAELRRRVSALFQPARISPVPGMV